MTIFIARNGNPMGGWPEEKVRHFLQAGTLFATDHYWREGMAQWDVLGNLPPPAAAFPAAPLPPAPAAAKPRKNPGDEPLLSRLSWLIPLLLTIAVGVLLPGTAKEGNVPRMVGYVLGNVIILFGLAFLVSLPFPRRMRLIIRCAVIAVLTTLLVMGQRSLATKKLLAEMNSFAETQQAAEREQAAKGQIVDNSAAKEAEIAKLKALSQDQSGSDRKVTEAGIELMQELNDKANACRAAENVMLKLGVDPAGVTSLDDLQKKHDAVVACQPPIEQLLAYLGNIQAEARTRLESRGVPPASIDQFIAGMRTKSSQLESVATYWRLENSMLTDIAARLDLVKDQWGKWHLNAAGEIVFEDGSKADAFNAINAKIKSTIAEQKAAQAKMLAPAPASAPAAQ